MALRTSSISQQQDLKFSKNNAGNRHPIGLLSCLQRTSGTDTFEIFERLSRLGLANLILPFLSLRQIHYLHLNLQRPEARAIAERYEL